MWPVSEGLIRSPARTGECRRRYRVSAPMRWITADGVHPDGPNALRGETAHDGSPDGMSLEGDAVPP